MHTRLRTAAGVLLAVAGAYVVRQAFRHSICLGSDCGPNLAVLAPGLLATLAGAGLVVTGRGPRD